jgi:hypothetical protein
MAEPSEAAEELLDAARYGNYADASAALDSGTPVNSADELGRTGELTDDHVATSSTTACHNVTVHLCMMQHLNAVSFGRAAHGLRERACWHRAPADQRRSGALDSCA